MHEYNLQQNLQIFFFVSLSSNQKLFEYNLIKKRSSWITRIHFLYYILKITSVKLSNTIFMDMKHHSFNMPVNVCDSRDGFFLFILVREKKKLNSQAIHK